MAEVDINQRIKTFLHSALNKFSARDYDKAIEDLKAAEVFDRDNPEILYNLGVCYCRKGLYKTAITQLQRLLGLPFTFVDIITVKKLLAYALIKSDSFVEAVRQLKEGLELSPKDTTMLGMLGYCFEKTGKDAEALSLFREIIEVEESNCNAFNSIACLLSKNGGDLSEALKYARKALDAKPDNPAYMDTLGFVYLMKGQTDLAKNFLKKALARMPESEEVREHVNRLLKIKNPQT